MLIIEKAKPANIALKFEGAIRSHDILVILLFYHIVEAPQVHEVVAIRARGKVILLGPDVHFVAAVVDSDVGSYLLGPVVQVHELEVPLGEALRIDVLGLHREDDEQLFGLHLHHVVVCIVLAEVDRAELPLGLGTCIEVDHKVIELPLIPVKKNTLVLVYEDLRIEDDAVTLDCYCCAKVNYLVLLLVLEIKAVHMALFLPR